jgi:hypothetical protein
MGFFNRLTNKPSGSIEETIRSILLPLSNFELHKPLSAEDRKMIIDILWLKRAEAAMLMNVTTNNYVTKNDASFYFKLMSSDLHPYKYDICLFILSVIYLESPSKRDVLEDYDENKLKELFTEIYDQCKKGYPSLLLMNKDNFLTAAQRHFGYIQRFISMLE